MPRGERPLGPGDEVLVAFARDLRRLRVRAGSPTYRELSGRAHFSAAALSEAAGGRKFPSSAVTVAYVAACGGDTGEWETRWRHTAAQLAASTITERETSHAAPETSDDGPAPYVGLVAFQPSDAEWFFGRDALVAELLTRLGERRFLGVFGPSGCGKSSVLRAGLIAHLNCEHVSKNGRCRVVVFTPGQHPVEECAVCLAGLLGQSPAALRDELAADPESLHLRIRQALVDDSDGVDLVLVVDQFEEIFTLCADTDERARFIDALTTAATAPTSRTRVVLGVRTDFYGHCAQHPRLVDALRDAQVMVGPMSADELRQAITQPAEHAGCRVETGLVTRVVADAVGQPGVLPLVSHALLETWRRRRGTTLTQSGYQTAGGIHHALAHTAEAIYTQMDDHQQQVARQIFLRLTALGEGTEDTKRRVHHRELGTHNPDTPDTGVVLDRLTTARLITVDQDSVELAHEALIRHWPRLRDWLAEDRDGLRIHRQLTNATYAWHAVDRDPGALYRGTRLARTHEWAADGDRALTPHERAFLDASVAADEHERRAGRRRARLLCGLVVVLVVLLVIATAAAVYATRSQQTATRQRNVAVALNAVRDAADLIDIDPRLAAHLSLAAYRLYPSQATRDSLIVTSAGASAIPLNGSGSDFVSVAPSGRLSAAARQDYDDTTLSTISNQPSTEVATLRGGLRAPRFSPDSRIVATVDQDAVARLWDVSDPTQPRILTTIPTKSIDFWFSPDSSLLLTRDAIEARSEEGPLKAQTKWTGTTGRLWDIADTGRPRELSTLANSSPELAVFTSDGRSIATLNSPQGKPMLWDITTPDTPQLTSQRVNMPSDTWMNGAAFAEKYRTLFVGDHRGYIRIWDVGTPGAPRIRTSINGHLDSITEIVPSPDNRSLAIADSEGALTVWSISKSHTPEKIIELRHNSSTFGNLMFSPDGRTVHAIGFSRTLNLFQWHLGVDQSAAIVCEQLTPRMTEAEWKKHFIGVPYQPACE